MKRYLWGVTGKFVRKEKTFIDAKINASLMAEYFGVEAFAVDPDKADWWYFKRLGVEESPVVLDGDDVPF